MRAAIYARYSTELQNENSITDQIALCRQFASREFLQVVAEFEDRALSGASMVNRNGVRSMLQQAEAKQFDVLIVEAFDRLARDIADLADIYKRLSFLGIQLRAVHDGTADTVMIGLRGLVGQLFREDNVKKIRRGQSALISKGLSAGGTAYGYRPDPSHRGKLVINDDEAAIVKLIFSDFLAGNSARKIAQRLNHEKIRPPRGRAWNASTINGNPARGSGILNNELYDGKIVWNKVRMVKNPDTGKRVSRPNPREKWVICEVPEYRILPEGQFENVLRLRRENRRERPEQYRRSKRILSGLLRCEACGSGMTTCGKDKTGRVRIRCSAARESGTCPDPKTFYLDAVEDLVVGSLLKELKKPEQVTHFVETYITERKRLVRDSERSRTSLEKRIAQKEREMGRLVDAIASGTVRADQVSGKLNELESERDQYQRELQAVPTPVDIVTLHPLALKRYEEKLTKLRDEIQEGLDQGYGDGADAIRALLDAVIVGRVLEDRGSIRVQIIGKLNALVGATGFGATSVVNDGSGGGT